MLPTFLNSAYFPSMSERGGGIPAEGGRVEYECKNQKLCATRTEFILEAGQIVACRSALPTKQKNYTKVPIWRVIFCIFFLMKIDIFGVLYKHL